MNQLFFSQLKIGPVQVLAVFSKLPNPACSTGVTTTAAALAKQGWQIMTIMTIYPNNDGLYRCGFMMWTRNYYGLKQFHKPCDWGSRDNKTKCQYNKRVRQGKGFGYFSSFFSKLSQEKIRLFHKFRLFIFMRPLGKKNTWKLQLYSQSSEQDVELTTELRRKAGLDSPRVLSKCSCINSLNSL